MIARRPAISSKVEPAVESVTAPLGELRKAGIIAIGRKRIRILNRLRLERAARE